MQSKSEKLTFDADTAQKLLASAEKFPVDGDQAASWLGIRPKRLLNLVFSNLDQDVDYTIPIYGTDQKIYLTAPAFKEIGMLSQTEKGRQIRKYFIECEARAKDATPPTTLAEWQEGRLKGKAVRRSLTDTIKIFCQYAEAQGSGNADRYYAHFSNLFNKYIIEGYPSAVKGVKDKRDRMGDQQLRYLAVIEEAISKLIDDRMMAGDDYHRVYEEAKARVAAIAAVLDIEPKPLLAESNKRLINQSLARALKAATA